MCLNSVKIKFISFGTLQTKMGRMLKLKLAFVSSSQLGHCVCSLSQSLLVIRLKTALNQEKAGEKAVFFGPY
jgi:hypothetical protein